MNAEQKAKAIACIEGAKRIGALRAFSDTGNPCCSIGLLVACAGTRQGKEARRKEKDSGERYDIIFPELTNTYGLQRTQVSELIYHNDSHGTTEDRRRAVLAYLSSIEVDS